MRLDRGTLVVVAVALTSCQVEEPPVVLAGSRWSELPASVPVTAFARADGIYVVLPEEEPRQVAGWGEEPLVSPDGTRVLFRRSAGHAQGFDAELWTVPVAGGEPTRAWRAGAFELAESAAWSESGRWIVFTRTRWRNTPQGPAVCGPTTCSGPARAVVLLRAEDAQARVLGPGTAATVSADERFVTWLDGGRMTVQEIDSAGLPIGSRSRT